MAERSTIGVVTKKNHFDKYRLYVLKVMRTLGGHGETAQVVVERVGSMRNFYDQVLMKKIYLFFILVGITACTSKSSPELVSAVREQCRQYATFSGETLFKLDEPVVKVQKLKEDQVIPDNIFHPSDSKIDKSFECKFRVNGGSGSVVLLLIKNKDFAYHTRWEEIPVREITLSSGEHYYVVAKYLDVSRG